MSTRERLILAALVLGLGVPGTVQAREIIGGDDEAEPEAPAKPLPKPKKDAAPPPAPAEEKAPPKPKKDAAPPSAEAPEKEPPKPAGKEAKGKPVPTSPVKEEKPAPAKATSDEDDVLGTEPAKDEKPGKGKPKDAKGKDAVDESEIRKAEQDAKKKREEEIARKKQVEAERRAAAGQVSMENAKSERALKRFAGGVLYTVKLNPGALEANALTEIVLDAREKLKEADPTYGDYAPLEDADLVATLTPAAAPAPAPEPAKKDAKKDPKAKAAPAPVAAPAPAPVVPVAYAVHSLGDAGVYGFHITFPAPGKWDVKLSGTRKDGKPLEGAFSLHVGVWPPPDFEQEEKNNQVLGGQGRRTVE